MTSGNRAIVEALIEMIAEAASAIKPLHGYCYGFRCAHSWVIEAGQGTMVLDMASALAQNATRGEVGA